MWTCHFNSATGHVLVRHGLIVPVVSHVVGSSRRWDGAGVFVGGHVFVLHRAIVPVVTHIMGSTLPIPSPTVGEGQSGDDEAEGGQRVFKFDFHDSCCLWLILVVIVFQRATGISLVDVYDMALP